MTQQRAILSEHDIEVLRLPLNQASSPPATYYKREHYELEVERIFLKEWLWVGRAEHVTEPGDYFSFTLVDEPIIVVRDKVGELRAFSAVCRHRGALLTTEKGNCKFFKCPYHAWTYALSGELLSAPEMEKVSGFDRSQHRLTELRAEIWEGIVFVNFDPQARPLASSLEDLSSLLENYKMGELVCTERRIYTFPANWKVTVENAVEAYHVLGTHETSAGTDVGDPRCWEFVEDTPGAYDVLINHLSEPVTYNVPGSVGKVAWVIESLTEKEQLEVIHVLLYPNLWLVCLPDHVLWFVMHPDGPDRTQVICNWLFPKHAVERPDFAELASHNYAGLERFNEQDSAMVGLAYRGTQSRLFRPGRYSLQEPIPHRFVSYILDRVHGASPQG